MRKMMMGRAKDGPGHGMAAQQAGSRARRPAHGKVTSLNCTARRSGAALRAVRTCICRDRAVLAHDGEHCGSCALGKLPRKLWASFWRPPTVVQYHGHGASKQSNSGEPNASKRRWLVGT